MDAEEYLMVTTSLSNTTQHECVELQDFISDLMPLCLVKSYELNDFFCFILCFYMILCYNRDPVLAYITFTGS